jgi:hypothetical protein
MLYIDPVVGIISQITEYKYIVAYLLKATTVEPEKQLLLANGSETTFGSRQRPQNETNTRC